MSRPEPVSTIQLLVVEDNPSDAGLIEAYLEESLAIECTLHHVTRLSLALEWLAENRPDAVLLDLGLPDSVGINTVRRFIDGAGQLPLIVLTGNDDIDIGVEAIQLGAQDYLVKDRLDPDLLGRVVRYARERNRIQEELRLLAAAFESSHAILITNRDGFVERVNPAFEAVTGYRAAEVLGQNPRLLQSGRHGDAFYADMWQNLEHRGRWSGEVWNRRQDGTVYPQWESITALYNEAGDVTHYVAVFHDITHQKDLETELERRATHDSLTGALNRLKLDELLEQEAARRQRYETPLSLVILDIDHFKVFNDTHGHQAGDAVLQEVVRRLQSRLRVTDFIGRWGGEEFMLILPNTDGAGAAHLAESVRTSVNDTPVGDGLGHVTLSAGAATMTGDESPEDLLKRADDALYRAKEEGRDRVVIAP